MSSPIIPSMTLRKKSVFSVTKSWRPAQRDVVIGGRLGNHRYYDMDQVIAAALKAAQEIL